MKNPQISVPNQFLNFFSAKVPGVWKTVDYYRYMRGKLEEDWDQCVFMPTSGWDLVMEKLIPKSPVEAKAFAAKNLQVIGAWRPTQDILRFDDDFYNMLTKTPVTGKLPVEIIRRIPAWALYFETRNLVVEGGSYDGFFAGLDQSNDRAQLILRLHFVAMEKMRILSFILPLGDWSVEEAVARTNEQQRSAMKRLNMEMTGEYTRVADQGLHAALNLLLYVCSYGLDEDRAYEFGSGIRYPQPVRIKRGNWRLFPPPKPVIHKLGNEIGEEARKYNERTCAPRPHGSPRPHIRRAHWHGYWRGPLNDQDNRKFSLKWLPPFMVGNPGGIPGNLQKVIKIVRAHTDSHFNPFCAQFRLIRGENMTERQSCQYFFAKTA